MPVVASDLNVASVGFLDNLSTTQSRIHVLCVPPDVVGVVVAGSLVGTVKGLVLKDVGIRSLAVYHP